MLQNHLELEFSQYCNILSDESFCIYVDYRHKIAIYGVSIRYNMNIGNVFGNKYHNKGKLIEK